MADGIVSLAVALAVPALAGSAVGNVALYALNLAFLAVVLLAYIALNHRRRGQELAAGRVFFFTGCYALYVMATAFLLSR